MVGNTPSDWIDRHLPMAQPGGRALDLACGAGRHVRLLLARGYRVTALDRDLSGLGALLERVEAVQADLENGRPWPLPERQFEVIVVVNYLHRPLLASIADALAPGGLLLYETFAIGNEKYGRPSNPDFLLRDGELLDMAQQYGLHVRDYQATDDGTAVKQRIAAQKPEFPRGTR